jgi:predicted transposase YbfD/YdcC
LIDPEQFESAFRRWVSSILPALGAEIVAIDGKTSRRSGGVDATALHLVSAFAAGAGLVLGQRATAEKSNEITAIPELLSTLALNGCTVTIDAMGTQTAIAEAIQQRGADYVLAVKDNQPKLAESIEDFWKSFRAHPACHTPHTFAQSVEKNHGRIEIRRCTVETQEWYSGTSSDRNEEDDVRKGIILAIGGLALLAGCGNQGDKASNVPVTPKWKGAPYHIAFDTQAAKPNPAGVTIPVIKYTANPEALEKRATLVVRFDASELRKRADDEPDDYGPGRYLRRGGRPSRGLHECWQIRSCRGFSGLTASREK